jgi:predicted transcriptional regulator
MPRHQTPARASQEADPTDAAQDSDLQDWHDARTREAVREADAGDFATFEDLKAVVRKYVRND